VTEKNVTVTITLNQMQAGDPFLIPFPELVTRGIGTSRVVITPTGKTTTATTFPRQPQTVTLDRMKRFERDRNQALNPDPQSPLRWQFVSAFTELNYLTLKERLQYQTQIAVKTKRPRNADDNKTLLCSWASSRAS
jgi:hypothetical protein